LRAGSIRAAITLALLVQAALALTACATAPSLARLDTPAREARLASDATAVATYRSGLRDVVAYVDARSDLFAPDRFATPMLPSREAREVWAAWQRFLDYALALDTIGRNHQRFAELAPPDRERSFAIVKGAQTRVHAAAS
jgi:hypothetical protein